jgi:hypothetical protein
VLQTFPGELLDILGELIMFGRRGLIGVHDFDGLEDSESTVGVCKGLKMTLSGMVRPEESG